MIIKVFFLILALILSFFQSTILPVNLLYLLVVLTAFLQSKFSFLYAFLAGLIFDLINSGAIGFSSLKFLFIAILVFLLQNRLPLHQKRQLKLPEI